MMESLSLMNITDTDITDSVYSQLTTTDHHLLPGPQQCSNVIEVDRQQQQASSTSSVNATASTNGPIRAHHPCRFCTKAFATQSNRIRHEKTVHSSQFSLQVCVCGASFITSGTLKRHRLLCKLVVDARVQKGSTTTPGSDAPSSVHHALTGVDHDTVVHDEDVTVIEHTAAATLPPVRSFVDMVFDVHASTSTDASDHHHDAPQRMSGLDVPYDTISDDEASSDAESGDDETNSDTDPSWKQTNNNADSDSDSDDDDDDDEDDDDGRKKHRPAIKTSNKAHKKRLQRNQSRRKQKQRAALKLECANLADSEHSLTKQVTETELQRICGPFLEWLAQPPCSSIETSIKTRRILTDAQKHPVKSNLKYLLNAVLIETSASPAITVDKLDLAMFKELEACRIVMATMEKRRVGAARLHTVLLLIKKVLVYLCCKESEAKKQYLTPNVYASFQYISSLCTEATQRRKRDARDRSTLGIASTSFFNTDPASVSTGAADTHTGNTHTKSTKLVATMTRDQLSTITSKCLAALHQLMLQQWSTFGDQRVRHAYARQFARLLVTSLLCLGLAPRSQVLKKLQIGTSLSFERGLYWMKLSSKESKNARPVLVPIAKELTRSISFYVETVRPTLLCNRRNDYLFLKRSGEGPREEFSSFTQLVTQDFVGVAFNAHAFRAGVITAFWQSGATEAEMVSLATTMAHDHATAKNYYFKPMLEDASRSANDRMSKILLSSSSSSSSSDSSSSSSSSHASSSFSLSSTMSSLSSLSDKAEVITNTVHVTSQKAGVNDDQNSAPRPYAASRSENIRLYFQPRSGGCSSYSCRCNNW
jgi:integrase